MYKILTAVLLFPATLFSQVIGHDLLAAQQSHFRADVAGKELPSGVAVGILDTTFGSDVAPVRTILSRIKPRYFRFHLIDATCIRNRTCERGLVQSGHTKASFDAAIRANDAKIKAHIQQRTRVFKSLCAEFPGTRCVGSPVLEHDLSVQSYRNAADWMLEVWPGLQLSNSADVGIKQEKYKGAWIELHGTNVPQSVDIVSTDGIDITDIDSVAFVKRHKNAKIVFLWTRSYNCRTQAEDFEMPKERTACPPRHIFQTVAHIADVLPPAPAFTGRQCKTIAGFKSPQVYKPLAEDKGTGDPRANFPVLISSFGRGQVNVLNNSGLVVGSLGYYGLFNSAFSRHYSRWPGGSRHSAYGFQRVSKGYSWLEQKGKCFGPTILGRRAGSYR